MKQTTIAIIFCILSAAAPLWFAYTLLTENKQLKQEVSMYSAKYRSTRLQEEVIMLLKQDTAIARYEAQRTIEERRSTAKMYASPIFMEGGTMNNRTVFLYSSPYDRREFSREARVAAQAYKDSIIALKYK